MSDSHDLVIRTMDRETGYGKETDICSMDWLLKHKETGRQTD